MRYRIFILALMIVWLVPGLGVGAQQGRFIVLVDPAHGGADGGVVSDKLREKDITLNIALHMRQESRSMANLQIQLTRSADGALSIAERIKAATAMKPDCLISLHINAGFGKGASGYEVYFPGFRQNAAEGGEAAPILKDMTANRYLNDSVRLAQQLQAGLETVFPRKGRGLRDASNPLLDGLAIPALIVEIGFASNTEERRRLTEEETQRAVARALLKGLQIYFQKVP